MANLLWCVKAAGVLLLVASLFGIVLEFLRR